MNFARSPEQIQFADALHDLLTGADTPGAARRWAAGDHTPGLGLWRRLAAVGVTALAVPEELGGLGAHPVDLVVACEELGHHALPGPVAESIAAVPALLTALDVGQDWLPALADGKLIATLAAPPSMPYAVDADVADIVLLAGDDGLRLGVPGSSRRSVDPTRRLFPVSPGAVLAAGSASLDLGTLANAAQLLGAGRALLELTTTYATQRTQFGRPIGEFQAVKHQLSNVHIGLEFARPLLYAAAIAIGSESAARGVSAAKVACADAAHLAARTALQVHGAIGYTREYDLSLWLTKVRALIPAFGTRAEHRARVMEALEGR